jgi:hypothetical protein
MGRIGASLAAIAVATGCGATAAAGAAAMAGPAAAGSPGRSHRLRVTPPAGHRRTTFTVHFTAPDPSGRQGRTTRSYMLQVSGPAGAHGCLDSVSRLPQATGSEQPLAVALRPGRRPARRWCVGTFTGTVEELVQPACGPVVARAQVTPCPDYVAAQRIGSFRFRVTR